MRVSRKIAEENRAKVVDTASELFREHGFDGIGIAALMKSAGLTNGAFYKQFENKEALAAEAVAHSLERGAAAWREALDAAGDGDPIAAWKRWYLSSEHVARRDKGCAYAALAAEAPRHGDAVKAAFREGVERMTALLTERLDDAPAEEKRQRALRILCEMTGALTLARAVDDPALAQELIAAVLET